MLIICSVLTYCSSFTSEGCVVTILHCSVKTGKEGKGEQKEAGVGSSLTGHNKATSECVEADLIIRRT